MILDSLSHSQHCLSLHPLMQPAFDYLRTFDASTPDGKYEVVGSDLTAAVQRYETAPDEEKVWEAHRVFADIQFLVAGTEKILHAPTEELLTRTPYNEAKDVEKFVAPTSATVSSLVLKAGTFCILYPHDGHKPGCMVGHPSPVVKVVLKLRL